jgi:hypothetical protein
MIDQIIDYRIPTQFKSRNDEIIYIGDIMSIHPVWTTCPLHFEVINDNEIKWKHKTTLRTELSYWLNYAQKRKKE